MKRALILAGAAALSSCSNGDGRFQLVAGRLQRADTRATTPAAALTTVDAVFLVDSRTGRTWELQQTILPDHKTDNGWRPIAPPAELGK